MPSRALAVEAFGLAAFAALCVWAAKVSGIWGLAARMGTRDKALVFGAACAFIVFAGWYFGQYHFHPTWDQLNYWTKTIQFNDMLRSSVHGTIAEVYRSISASDYNFLLSWILSLPCQLFTSWEGFHFSLAVLFHIPLALACALLVVRVSGAPLDRGGFIPTLFLCALCFPVFARIPFAGLSDAPAALLLVLSAGCFLSPELPERRSCAVLGAVTLCGSFLLRRYFVYGAMGLAAGALVFWLIELAGAPRAARRGLFAGLLKALGWVLAVVAVTVPVSPGFYARSLFGNQRTAYQSWTTFDSYAAKLGAMADAVGWLWIALPVAAIIALAVYGARRRAKGWSSARGSVFPGVCAAAAWLVVALLMFWQVQDLSVQHWYIVMAPMLLAVLLPVLGGLACISRAGARRCGLFAMGALAVVSLGSAFNVLPAVPLLPDNLISIKREADYEEKRRLISELASMAGEGETVYFACASGSLNSSLTNSVNLVDGVPVSYIRMSSDVDSRDGFNTGFFDAEYVVTSDPVQLHMSEDRERVVATLNALVRDPGGYVGCHYEPAGEYEFAGGVGVTVYRRTSDFTADDVRALRDTFDAYYPDSPELFRDRFDAYLEGMGE